MPTKAGIDRYGAYISAPLPKWWGGFSVGPASIVNEDTTPDEIAHETRHRKQFFLPGWSLLKLVDAFYPYKDKPTERDAFAHSQPQLESKTPRGPISRAADAYMRALLGDGMGGDSY